MEDAQQAAPTSQRDARVDFFRGLALLFIFVDHIPENILSNLRCIISASLMPPMCSLA